MDLGSAYFGGGESQEEYSTNFKAQELLYVITLHFWDLPKTSVEVGESLCSYPKLLGKARRTLVQVAPFFVKSY